MQGFYRIIFSENYAKSVRSLGVNINSEADPEPAVSGVLCSRPEDRSGGEDPCSPGGGQGLQEAARKHQGRLGVK